MMRHRFYALAVGAAVLALLACPPGWAQDPQQNRIVHLELTAGGDYMTGHSDYSIGGSSTISELHFPLDVWLWSIGGRLTVLDRFNFGIRYRGNISNDPGTVTDSDFGVFSRQGISLPTVSPNSLDLYSETEASLDADLLDLYAEWGFFKRADWTFLIGFAYTYQKFSYDLSNIVQHYPSLPGIPPVSIQGSIAEYEVKYKIPMITGGITFGGGKSRFGMEARFGYSWYAKAEDHGNWFSRQPALTFDGDNDGPAYNFSLNAHYDLTPNWFLGAGVEYLKVDADGTQTQTLGGRGTATVDQDIDTEQTSVILQAGFRY
jgi:opacity protein-like surface antigen